MKLLTLLSLAAASSLICGVKVSSASVEGPAPKASTPCRATREFITVLEFLRDDENFKLKEPEAREVAFKVANGCTGAAARFIRVSKALLKSGANRKNSTEAALKFAAGSDAETDAFISAFRRSIAEDGLDLDFDSSLKIALSLSKEFSGDLKKVRKDFESLVDYCSDSSKLNLPKNQCGAFAARVAKRGEPWKDGVSKPFIQTYEYLASEKGPALVAAQGLPIAENLVTDGPGGMENFKQAYQYATSDKGLGLNRDEAIGFAKKMAAVRTPELRTAEPKEGQAKPSVR